jgi:ribose transport system permease protein
MLLLDPKGNATNKSNIFNILNLAGFFGVLTLGVGVVIITGGIDLSIGSVVGLSAVLFGVLMDSGLSPFLAVAVTLLGGVLIGALHGTLITKMKLQPFLVTLCGLFVYRGFARMLSPGQQVGLLTIVRDARAKGDAAHVETLTQQIGFLRRTLIGFDSQEVLVYPLQIVVLAVLAVVIGIVLHRSAFGRYWYALGHNEQAAKYAGIRVERNKFAVYVLCSALASFGGILTLLDYGSVTPESIGQTWELYAITGAVLGGCSLRGGEGSVLGMVLGAIVLPLLENLISFLGAIPWVEKHIKSVDPIIPVLIGLTLLIGTIADEYFRRRSRT